MSQTRHACESEGGHKPRACDIFEVPMDLRIRTLEHLDARSVKLPHGTEVVTRTDRMMGDRRVPQGSIGRVTKVEGEDVEVAIVGIGTFRYARSELSPRRVGQMLYAQRRESAWSALEPCVVLDTIVGSHAWGLSDETSDEDHRGAFALPLSWTVGLAVPPEDLISADGSATFWSTSKAIRQALRADPNTLEMLFLPSARATDPIGEWILSERDAFVSLEIYGTFGRYALGQLHRLEQSQRLAEHRGVVLEWLRSTPTLTLNQVAEKLSKVATRALPSEQDRLHHAKQYVKQLYRAMHDQGLIESNEFSALVRFASDHSVEFDLPRELRPKNAYNLIRLLWTATQWLREGAPSFVAEGALHHRLFAIKNGKVALDEILSEAEEMAKELEAAKKESRLAPRPDVERANLLMRRIGEEVAARWIHQSPGPLGREAPKPPEVSWNE